MLRLLPLDNRGDDVGCQAGECDQLSKPRAASAMITRDLSKRVLRIREDQLPYLMRLDHDGSELGVSPGRF